jgi:hypothetical protein
LRKCCRTIKRAMSEFCKMKADKFVLLATASTMSSL